MKNSKSSPRKILSQKGHGMLEYALLLTFATTIFLFGMARGGFGDSLESLYDNARGLLASIGFDDDTGGSSGSSSSSSSSNSSSSSSSGSSSANSSDSAADVLIPSPAARPLDWQEILRDIKLTFTTITQGQDPNRAIASEYNLFAQVSSISSGAKEYNYKDTDLKGWNDLMAQMESQMADSNFTSSYKKASTGETFSISRQAGTNRVTLSYFDGNDETKTFTIYADSNNVMQLESPGFQNNSEEILTKYMSVASNIYSGGWQYQK